MGFWGYAWVTFCGRRLLFIGPKSGSLQCCYLVRSTDRYRLSCENSEID